MISFHYFKDIFPKINHNPCRKANDGYLNITPRFMEWEAGVNRQRLSLKTLFLQKQPYFTHFNAYPSSKQYTFLMFIIINHVSLCNTLLNEYCFKTLSSIFQNIANHCWPSYVHCSDSVSMTWSLSASYHFF